MRINEVIFTGKVDGWIPVQSELRDEIFQAKQENLVSVNQDCDFKRGG